METNRKFLLNLLILVTLFSCAPAPQILFFRRVSVNTDVPESKRLSDSTLQIVSDGRDVGTGFFVAHDKIATNIHVIARADLISVHVRGRRTSWSIRGVTAYDVKNDLLILKISGKGVPFPIGDSDAVKNGESISVIRHPRRIGYPRGVYQIPEGIIHSIRNSDKWFQTTVNPARGNSGSPVLNSKKEVIGVLANMDNTYTGLTQF